MRINHLTLLMLVTAATIGYAATRAFDFAADVVGQPPKGFAFGHTAKVGAPGTWVVQAEGANKYVAQTNADSTRSLALWPHLTVAKNLEFVLRAANVPRVERAVRGQRALEMMRIGPLGGRYPHQLSGGEQQRVALARALVARPELLLLDEPFSSLDPDLRATLRAELMQIRRDLQVTMVYVTHDREDAAALGSNVVPMRAGRIDSITSDVGSS
jgi:ABC-type nitrate/sulfonate/bicarbonate transport system ATPase subunit